MFLELHFFARPVSCLLEEVRQTSQCQEKYAVPNALQESPNMLNRSDLMVLGPFCFFPKFKVTPVNRTPVEVESRNCTCRKDWYVLIPSCCTDHSLGENDTESSLELLSSGLSWDPRGF